MRVMVAIGLVAAVAVLTLAVPSPGQDRPRPPGIVGEDNRVPINSKEWPWSAIGRVNRATGGFCTGVLIAPQHVLTVAHCLYDQRLSRWTDPGDLHFVAGYSRGDFVSHMLVDRVILPPEYAPDDRENPRNLANDWAIIVVRGSAAIRPIRWQMLSQAEIAAGLTTGALTRAGYGQDRQHMLSAHQGCSIVGWDGDLLLHDCDGTRGDSGSPILMRRYGETTVVGLNVGFRESAGNTLGVAVPATQFHATARDAASGR